MKTKPVLIIAPAEWNGTTVANAESAGYLPIQGDDRCLTHILEDPNVYKADQRAYFAALALQGMLTSPLVCADTFVMAVEMADKLIVELNKPVS